LNFAFFILLTFIALLKIALRKKLRAEPKEEKLFEVSRNKLLFLVQPYFG
jgi:hypothetical protein